MPDQNRIPTSSAGTLKCRPMLERRQPAGAWIASRTQTATGSPIILLSLQTSEAERQRRDVKVTTRSCNGMLGAYMSSEAAVGANAPKSEAPKGMAPKAPKVHQAVTRHRAPVGDAKVRHGVTRLGRPRVCGRSGYRILPTHVSRAPSRGTDRNITRIARSADFAARSKLGSVKDADGVGSALTRS